MNQTIQSMKNHRSIRKYLEKEIPDDVLDNILRATQIMPTSNNGQQVSVIVVKNKEIKSQLSILSGNQPWVKTAPVFLLFVVDFYKTHLAAQKHGVHQIIHQSVEGSVAGILDAGIALGGAIVAAESLGLGTVAIGGIRNSVKEVINLLGLPQYTFPVNGLCIGYPDNMSSQKPRLPLSTFAHLDKYFSESFLKDIDNYDVIMQEYLQGIGRVQEIDWSTQTSKVYKSQTLTLKEILIDQGFNFE